MLLALTPDARPSTPPTAGSSGLHHEKPALAAATAAQGSPERLTASSPLLAASDAATDGWLYWLKRLGPLAAMLAAFIYLRRRRLPSETQPAVTSVPRPDPVPAPVQATRLPPAPTVALAPPASRAAAHAVATLEHR